MFESVFDDHKVIKVKYMHEDTRRLEINPKGDWIDCYADATIEILPKRHALIPLGICIQLPPGYEAHLAARSSLFKRTGLIVANGFGIIDESYCGDNDQWMLSVWSTGSVTSAESEHGGVIINRGDKIAQFRIIQKMPKVFIHEVPFLNHVDRGGFGSTGN